MPNPQKGSTSSSGKSSLFKKLGSQLNKAHEAHKGDETEYGQMNDLPSGVRGIAELVEIKFDEYKKGENIGKSFFYAAGVVVKTTECPKGEKVVGLRTSIMEPIMDTPSRSRKTVEDHWKWVLNELRKLGINTADLEAEEIEDMFPTIAKAGIHFKFRTWSGKPSEQFPDPRTNHTWEGIVEYDENEDEDNDLEDDTVDEVSDEQNVDDSKQDLNSLAAKADEGNEAARKALTEKALEAGISQKVISKAESWEAVKDMIVEAAVENTGDEETEEEEKESTGPEVGEQFKYLPIDPKTKKPYVDKSGKKKNAVDVEVLSINTSKKTCKIKNMDDGETVYENVPIADLMEL